MDIINFTPFPNLATERLKLRQMKIEDAHEIFILRSDERILKFLDIPKATTVDDARKYIGKINEGITRNEWIMWGISLQNNDTLIGTICYWNISKEHFTADIGFVLHPDFQGKGIMLEVLATVLDYGFNTIRFNFIDAVIDPDNVRSIKLLEKNGFAYDRKSNDTLIYSLVNHKYRE